jgi:hypothetical protein
MSLIISYLIWFGMGDHNDDSGASQQRRTVNEEVALQVVDRVWKLEQFLLFAWNIGLACTIKTIVMLSTEYDIDKIPMDF